MESEKNNIQEFFFMQDHKHPWYSIKTQRKYRIPWPETFMVRIPYAIIMFLLISNFHSYFNIYNLVAKIVRHLPLWCFTQLLFL